MFKKLFIFSIASSLLLSIPVVATGTQNAHETLIAAYHKHEQDQKKEIKERRSEI
jgi:hypothetical protein